MILLLGVGIIAAITFYNIVRAGMSKQNSGTIIENAIINSIAVNVLSSVKLTSDTFLAGGLSESGGSGLYVSGGSPLISDNIIKTEIIIDGGLPVYSAYNTITLSGGSPSAAGITLAENDIGCNPIIERNLITGNSYAGIGIYLYNNVDCTASIINNTVTDNAIGIYVIQGYSLLITNNNIYNNTLNVKLIENDPVDCSNNWWGNNRPAGN